MAELGGVTRALLAMARDGTDGRGLAGGICRACVDGLDVDGAALSLLTTSDARETLWATDPVAQLLEELQFTLNEGACVEAATSGNPVFVADLQQAGEARRWPLFAAAVADRTSVRALFALPLQWGAVNLGVLDLYRVAPGALADAQWRDALSAADTAALMILGQRTEPAGTGEGWFDPEQGSRVEVHQATGMVLVQLGVSAAEALARMRGYAFAHHRLLVDVAGDVIERRLVFTPEME